MRALILRLLVVCCCAAVANAADVSPTLDYLLNQAAADEYVSGIVILESPVDIAALDLTLHARKAPLAERYDEVYHALRYNANQTQPKFQAELDAAIVSGLVKGYKAYWIENLFVVFAKRDFFDALRNRGDIHALSENFDAVLIEPVGRRVSAEPYDETRVPERRSLDEEEIQSGQIAVGATRVNRELGITGQGVLVGNLDTGVDGNHPALAARWRGNFAPASECWMDFITNNPDLPTDINSHGTHVMGTMCGREIQGTGDTITVGSAPDALWIAANAIMVPLDSLSNDVLDAYEWFANPDGDPGTLDDVPDVIQNSWGINEGFGFDECYDFWNTAIVNMEALGVVVTFSAGNESTSGLRSPAIHELSEVQMFSVGAVSAQTGELPPYDIAPFSSQGPSPCNGTHIKPEISAPGVEVFSSVPGGGYEFSGWSGTSMAGPHVAGIVALMRQACPDCDPITIKEALLNTAIDEGYGATGNDNVFGYGFIDGYNAVLAVSNLGYVQSNVTFNGSALAGVEVAIEGTNSHGFTNAQGNISLPVAAGSYTVTFRKFGFNTVLLNNVVVATGDTTIINQAMTSAPEVTISGHVYDGENMIIAGATVTVLNTPVPATVTDENGSYQVLVPVGDTYTLRARGADLAASRTLFVNGHTILDFRFPVEHLCYDFENGDQGWTLDAAASTATVGDWVRMDPEETQNNSGTIVQPENDHTAAPGSHCYVTDGNSGNTVGDFDVDGGITILLSPVWDLSQERGVVMGLYSWFSNDNGNTPGQDHLDIEITSDGIEWISMLHENEDWETWRRDMFVLEEYITLSSQVQVRITAQDLPSGSLVEAAIDDVCLYAATTEAPEELTAIMTETGIALNWQAVPGAASYTVWRGTQFPPTTLNATIISNVTDTEFIDTTSLDTIGFYIVTANR